MIDAAVGGYGLDQIVLRAEMLMPLLHPRLLLLQTRLEFGNSIDLMSVAGGAPKPYFKVKEGKLTLHNDPVPKLASRPTEIGWLRALFGYSYLVQNVMTRLNLLQWWVGSDALRNKSELTESEADDVGCSLVGRLAELRDKEKIRIALVVQYSGLDAMAEKLHWERSRSRILDCAEQQHLEVVDTLDTLRSIYKQGDLAAYQRLWQMEDNNRVYGHMSAEGNQLIADVVTTELISRSLSDAGNKSAR